MTSSWPWVSLSSPAHGLVMSALLHNVERISCGRKQWTLVERVKEEQKARRAHFASELSNALLTHPKLAITWMNLTLSSPENHFEQLFLA